MTKQTGLIFVVLFVILVGLGARTRAAAQRELVPVAYLPLVLTAPLPEFACATASTRQYVSGPVYQYDLDNPPRPAYNHADKNIALRGYILNTDPNLRRQLVDYGSDDPTQPPQLATLFQPYRVPPFAGFHKAHHWQWAPSPNPGVRREPIDAPPTTAVAFILPPGELLRVPVSGYDIGGGAEVVILFADADTITLHYTREDTAGLGYTIHIDRICTDPNLLALYNSLDAPGGPRYQFPSSGYQLPALPAGKVFGTSSNEAMVVAIVDTGAFQDPRSCNEWWQIKPGYAEPCPPAWQGEAATDDEARR
jgi:hypothetical protein